MTPAQYATLTDAEIEARIAEHQAAIEQWEQVLADRGAGKPSGAAKYPIVQPRGRLTEAELRQSYEAFLDATDADPVNESIPATLTDEVTT